MAESWLRRLWPQDRNAGPRPRPTVAHVANALPEPAHLFSPQSGSTIYITIIGDVTGGQIGAAGGNLVQLAPDNTHNEAILSWLSEYRTALPQLDEVTRVIAEQQLAQVTAEIQKPEPHPAIVRGLLHSLRTFAQNAVTAAGAGAGTMGLEGLISNWPL